MNYISAIENIIKNEKYVRNDIGMGRVQYARILKVENELFIIIVSNELEGPLVTRVERIMVVNGEIIIFYDGEYGEIIEKNERDDYKNVIRENEWDAIFSNDAGRALEHIEAVTAENGFYAEMHETMEDYIDEGYEEKVSEEICKHFNLL